MKKAILGLLPAAFLVLFAYVFQPAFITDFENRILDYRFSARGAVPADDRIVIVGIDQNSLQKIDHPFFSMGPIFAELADAATNASAAGLLFDVIFSPSSEGAIKSHVADICKKIKLDLPQKFFRELGFERPFRAALLNMRRTNTQPIVGYAWEKNQSIFSDKAILRIVGAENTGYFNLLVDPDGKVRRARLFEKANDSVEVINSVAMLAARTVATEAASLKQNQVQINYCGPAGTISIIPLIELLDAHRNGKSLTDKLNGKIVLVGFTDITDFKSTPYGYMPGVEIHANIIDNILKNKFQTKVGRLTELVWLLLFAVIIFTVSLFNRRRAVMVALVVAIGWVITSDYLFINTWLMVFRPVSVLLFYALTLYFQYFFEVFSDRKRIRSIFGRYVSDAVIKEVLASNNSDFISGKRRRLCVLIADIRGFTTYSEGHEAHEVVELLNKYFARLTSIIMKNNGVVDKFLGDGLLAFFNAPVERDDYIDDAVNSALEIIDFTSSDEFREICNGSDLSVGIALHAGQVVFGNIGSEKKAEFTVIGDAVNTCSRMESLNKEYGTTILVSREIVDESKLDLKWRFLDKKVLRGKSNEIELYTID